MFYLVLNQLIQNLKIKWTCFHVNYAKNNVL